MMRFICLFLACIVLVNPVLVVAQNITDLSPSDGAYSSAQKAVKGGYMPVYGGGKFLGDNSVSRKELAVVLDKLLNATDQTNLSLSRAEIQELVYLARTFKTTFTELESLLSAQKDRISLLENTQKNLNHDNSQMIEEMKALKEEIKGYQDQQLFMWIGIGAAALVGIIIK